MTKLDLARYYAAVAEWMLPHVQGRPLTLLRWDEGRASAKGGIFMRHTRAWGPDALRRVRIREKTKVGEYLVVDHASGLVALAQMDVLEIHTWNALADDVEHPDRLVFDLDPGEGVAWPAVVDAACDVRERLRALGLECWPKTTGGKGLHLVVPLAPATWEGCFEFARAFARHLARTSPRRYVATMGKPHRVGRIFVDYLRNNRTSTSVAALSIRAKPHAPVSTPVSFAELARITNETFTMRNVLSRLRALAKDPWAGYSRREQTLPSPRAIDASE